MAIGDQVVTLANKSYAVELTATTLVANGVPSGATAGLDINALCNHGSIPDKVRVAVRSTAGSGTMTATARVWLYAGGRWYVAKALAAADSAPQTAVAIAETGTDTIAYSEEVTGLRCASRIYGEVVAVAGTGTSIAMDVLVG